MKFTRLYNLRMDGLRKYSMKALYVYQTNKKFPSGSVEGEDSKYTDQRLYGVSTNFNCHLKLQLQSLIAHKSSDP